MHIICKLKIINICFFRCLTFISWCVCVCGDCKVAFKSFLESDFQWFRDVTNQFKILPINYLLTLCEPRFLHWNQPSSNGKNPDHTKTAFQTCRSRFKSQSYRCLWVFSLVSCPTTTSSECDQQLGWENMKLAFFELQHCDANLQVYGSNPTYSSVCEMFPYGVVPWTYVPNMSPYLIKEYWRILRVVHRLIFSARYPDHDYLSWWFLHNNQQLAYDLLSSVCSSMVRPNDYFRH